MVVEVMFAEYVTVQERVLEEPEPIDTVPFDASPERENALELNATP